MVFDIETVLTIVERSFWEFFDLFVLWKRNRDLQPVWFSRVLLLFRPPRTYIRSAILTWLNTGPLYTLDFLLKFKSTVNVNV